MINFLLDSVYSTLILSIQMAPPDGQVREVLNNRVLQEPLMTWNFFLTAFLVPVCSALTVAFIMVYINWKLKKQAAEDTEIANAKIKADADIATAKMKADADIADKKYKQEEEIARLKCALESEKAEATQAWRKVHADTLCKVKERVDGIYSAMDKKVDKDDCDRLMEKH